MWEYWGCGDIVQILDQLMDDCMENLDSGVLRGILVLAVSPGIIFFVVLSAAVHPFMCSPCMDYYIPFSS